MKSVLVIDTPPNCMDCPIATMIKDKVRDKYEAYCTPCGKFNEQIMTKPEWCPLKSMPHKLQAEWYSEGYKEGWNACIAELEGKDD